MTFAHITVKIGVSFFGPSRSFFKKDVIFPLHFNFTQNCLHACIFSVIPLQTEPPTLSPLPAMRQPRIKVTNVFFVFYSLIKMI